VASLEPCVGPPVRAPGNLMIFRREEKTSECPRLLNQPEISFPIRQGKIKEKTKKEIPISLRKYNTLLPSYALTPRIEPP